MQRVLYRVRRFFSKPYNVILVAMCVVLAYLTLLPMLSMIRDTVTVHVAETMRLKKPVGSFTWEHWRKVLFDASSLSIF